MEQYIKYNTPFNISDALIKCLTYNNYQVSVFCNDKVKRDSLQDSIIKILKLAGINFRANSREIVFIDSKSFIRFNPINENVRGQRHHEAILIGEIDEEFIDSHIRPRIISYRREG